MAGHKKFNELKAKFLANPAVRAYYEAQAAEYKAEYDRFLAKLADRLDKEAGDKDIN